MEKNINFVYDTTKDQPKPTKNDQQTPQFSTRNGVDLKKIVQNYQFWLGNIISKNIYSQVYSGTQKRTHKSVAIKVIPIQKSLTSKQHLQIDNEIKFCKFIPKHKNIIPILDTFSTSNNYYIMMDKAQIDLKTFLIKKKILSEEQVIGIMLDILEGLRHLYMNGFIHCNVKPSNILICFDGAKLTDFGQTRKIGQQYKNQFQPNQWTPYMNHLTLVTRTYDQNNDVWALAVLIYECLHGYHNYPWKFQTYSDLLQKIYELNIQYSRKISKQMIDFLNKVLNPKNKIGILDLYNDPFIKNCLQKRKNDRKSEGTLFNNDVDMKSSPVKYSSEPFGKFSGQLPVANRMSANINYQSNQIKSPYLQMKRRASNYQTSQSPTHYPPRKTLLKQISHLNPKQILDCQISYMRFINIVLKQDQHGYLPEKFDAVNTDPKYIDIYEKKEIDHKLFRFVLIKQLLGQKQCLNKTIDQYHPQNPFFIQGIQQFLCTFQGKQIARTYRMRLKEYDEKYKTLSQQMQRLIVQLTGDLSKIKCEWRPRDILTSTFERKQILSILGVRLSRQLCKHIWHEIDYGYTLLSDPKIQGNEKHKNQVISQMQQKARRVDFLMSYYILNCLLIDNFTSAQNFVKNSRLDIIMNNKPLKMQLQHFRLVQQKLRSLQII